MSGFDVRGLAIDAPPLRQARRRGYFIKGPIDLAWACGASALGGKALNVGLALWFYAGLEKRKTVRVSLTKIAAMMGFDQATASRALKRLEKAQLVRVIRTQGRKPEVTILDVHRDAENTNTEQRRYP